jgi:hypothetical protein
LRYEPIGQRENERAVGDQIDGVDDDERRSILQVKESSFYRQEGVSKTLQITIQVPLETNY